MKIRATAIEPAQLMINNNVSVVVSANGLTPVAKMNVSSQSWIAGKSAYQVWLDQGNTGTEQDFLDSLKGDPGTSSIASIVATEDLNIYDVITGNGKRATSGNITYRNKIVGLAMVSILNGFSGNVQTGGTITNPAWSFVAGDRIYLNEYVLSTTPPTTGFSIQIGIATATDTINIEIQTSILL